MRKGERKKKERERARAKERVSILRGMKRGTLTVFDPVATITRSMPLTLQASAPSSQLHHPPPAAFVPAPPAPQILGTPFAASVWARTEGRESQGHHHLRHPSRHEGKRPPHQHRPLRRRRCNCTVRPPAAGQGPIAAIQKPRPAALRVWCCISSGCGCRYWCCCCCCCHCWCCSCQRCCWRFCSRCLGAS